MFIGGCFPDNFRLSLTISTYHLTNDQDGVQKGPAYCPYTQRSPFSLCGQRVDAKADVCVTYRSPGYCSLGPGKQGLMIGLPSTITVVRVHTRPSCPPPRTRSPTHRTCHRSLQVLQRSHNLNDDLQSGLYTCKSWTLISIRPSSRIKFLLTTVCTQW